MMSEIPMDKMRFVETGEGLDVTYPQCVGCRYNVGGWECEELAEKPAVYMSNEEECPMREEEQ